MGLASLDRASGFASLPDRRDLLLVMQRMRHCRKGKPSCGRKPDCSSMANITRYMPCPPMPHWTRDPPGQPMDHRPGWTPTLFHYHDQASCRSVAPLTNTRAIGRSRAGSHGHRTGLGYPGVHTLTRHDALWVEASVWFALQPEHYGMPDCGSWRRTRRGRSPFRGDDLVRLQQGHRGWVGSLQHAIPLVWDCDTLFVFSEHIFPGLADDLLIREVSDTIYTPVPGQSDRFSSSTIIRYPGCCPRYAITRIT